MYNINKIDMELQNTLKPYKLANITYNNYINKQLILSKYKVPHLKATARQYKLRIGGKKQELIDRIETFFNKISNVILIQKIYRGFLVRNMIKLRGPALNNRKLCVNETDFCSMENIDEIDNDYFYSFTDSKNIVYGFNITSLIELFKRKSNTNPYTREEFSNNIINNIVNLYNLSFIICNNFSKINIRYRLISNTQPRYRIRNRVSNRYSPIPRLIHSEEDLTRYLRIANIRDNTIEYRINELFIEIDVLGNYTDKQWFSNLEISSYIKLYRKLYEIWYYRSELTRETQNNICPFYGPFDGIFSRPVLHSDLSRPQIQEACLIVFENMIYSGINNDFRKIGTLHCLSALTLVSDDAKNALPWLYESVSM